MTRGSLVCRIPAKSVSTIRPTGDLWDAEIYPWNRHNSVRSRFALDPGSPIEVSMFDDKTILITGGTGSFGRRYVKTLLETLQT